MPNHYNREPLLPPEDTPWSPDSPGGKTAPASRAWIELDTAALEQNVNFLRSRLPEHCRLMPAVKAQAYGHGAALISRQLNRLGVDAFCVACVSEGIELREAGVQGEILILGYTSPEDFPLLCGYGLTQTVIDYPYAQELNRFGQTLHVHIGVDTGMHRVGIRCEKIEEIAAVYQMENLTVDGIFTHLCASDSPHPDHRSFTKSQVLAFGQVVDILQEQGLPCPGQHLLASYGILNLLPDRAWHEGPVPPVGNRGGLDGDRLAADYVRPGIVLYGVLGSQTDLDVWKDFLRPVLSLKAKVASIRPLYAGESVGYGITYTAEKNMKIAAVTIGYGDGLPRELSNGKGSVLIHGHRAPIVGRICMDQTIVDISGIPHVHAGDDAVIIGSSGTLEITAGQIAEQCGTITHEILTGLAPRLDRIWV
nr:alanine racemase [uncultured Acetatifactor sp.]